MAVAYIAEPIDLRAHSTEKLLKAWHAHLRYLREDGYILYRPGLAFDFIATGPEAVRPNMDIFNINQAVLSKVNRVVALLHGRSIGVPAETQWAVEHGIRIDIFTTGEIAAKSWQLAGWDQYEHVTVVSA